MLASNSLKFMIFCAKVVNMTTLIGPKWAHRDLILIFTKDFKVSRERKGFQECKQVAEKDRQGGGRGRVNPPPCGLVLRFWRFGGYGT